MIVVVGRPGMDAAGRLSRIPGMVALAVAEAGEPVELVGSVGDDAAGDAVIVALGRAGIGHAALMRDPAAATPAGDIAGSAHDPATGQRSADSATPPDPVRLPRLDASDVELGLRYLPECRVLVLAEPVGRDVRDAVTAAAAYHGAALVAVVAAGQQSLDDLPQTATQLVNPATDDGSFAADVGRHAVATRRASAPKEATREATDEAGR
jgi:sugar/nucleoside kinase (ribokinase family)